MLTLLADYAASLSTFAANLTPRQEELVWLVALNAAGAGVLFFRTKGKEFVIAAAAGAMFMIPLVK